MEDIRLGYACINITLQNRPKKVGGKVLTGRTCRMASWKPTWDLQKISDLALANATDLLTILQWNNEHKIKFFRLGSELFPWHDHYELTDLPDYDLIKDKLFECGEYARANGMRITTHPGPFHVLGSPNPDVVTKSLIGLERHSETFDLMGYEPSFENKINIHIGGAYGGQYVETAERWIAAWRRLSDSARKRVVIENDDKQSLWTVQMLYDYFHKEIGIPITFDYHHHALHPGELSTEAALKLAASTWPDDVRQCVHYSESRRREKHNSLLQLCENNNLTMEDLDDMPTFAKIKKDYAKTKEQAHSDYIIDEIDTYGLSLDIMVEAKAKELCILEYLKNFPHSTKIIRETVA